MWIKEVEMVDSVDELRSSSSTRGISMPNFEVLDARIASALNRIIHNTQFKRKISLEEQKAQKEDRFLRGRQIAYLIYETGEPHERSPNAPKFEDRSQEETEWQEQGAREAAWKLAKRVLKLKEHQRATFFSPSETRCLPASSEGPSPSHPTSEGPPPNKRGRNPQTQQARVQPPKPERSASQSLVKLEGESLVFARKMNFKLWGQSLKFSFRAEKSTPIKLEAGVSPLLPPSLPQTHATTGRDRLFGQSRFGQNQFWPIGRLRVRWGFTRQPESPTVHI